MDHQSRPACLLPETELYPLCGKRSAGAFGLSVTGALRTCGRPARIGLSEIARPRRGLRRAQAHLIATKEVAPKCPLSEDDTLYTNVTRHAAGKRQKPCRLASAA